MRAVECRGCPETERWLLNADGMADLWLCFVCLLLNNMLAPTARVKPAESSESVAEFLAAAANPLTAIWYDGDWVMATSGGKRV